MTNIFLRITKVKVFSHILDKIVSSYRYKTLSMCFKLFRGKQLLQFCRASKVVTRQGINDHGRKIRQF